MKSVPRATGKTSEQGKESFSEDILGGGDSDANTVQDTACNQLTIVLARDLNSSSDEPPEASKEDGVSSSVFV